MTYADWCRAHLARNGHDPSQLSDAESVWLAERDLQFRIEEVIFRLTEAITLLSEHQLEVGAVLRRARSRVSPKRRIDPAPCAVEIAAPREPGGCPGAAVARAHLAGMGVRVEGMNDEEVLLCAETVVEAVLRAYKSPVFRASGLRITEVEIEGLRTQSEE